MKIDLNENERDFLLKELTGTHPLESIFREQSEKKEQYKNSIIRKLKK